MFCLGSKNVFSGVQRFTGLFFVANPVHRESLQNAFLAWAGCGWNNAHAETRFLSQLATICLPFREAGLVIVPHNLGVPHHGTTTHKVSKSVAPAKEERRKKIRLPFLAYFVMKDWFRAGRGSGLVFFCDRGDSCRTIWATPILYRAKPAFDAAAYCGLNGTSLRSTRFCRAFYRRKSGSFRNCGSFVTGGSN